MAKGSSFYRVTFVLLQRIHVLCCKKMEIEGTFLSFREFLENPERGFDQYQRPLPDIDFQRFRKRKGIRLPWNSVALIEELDPSSFINLKLIK